MGHDLLEPVDHLLQIVNRQVGVRIHSPPIAHLGEGVFEGFVCDVEDHRAEHLDETAIGVEHEVSILGDIDHALDDVVVEADVEHRVHHPGHGELGTRAARHEQWIGRITEALAGFPLHMLQRIHDLRPHVVRKLLAGVEVRVARFGGHRETGRHRDPDPGHLPEIGPLSTEESPNALPIPIQSFLGCGNLVKPVYILGHHQSSTAILSEHPCPP